MTSKRDFLATVFWFAWLGLIYLMFGMVGLAGAGFATFGAITAIGICTGYWVGSGSDILVIELMKWAKANPERAAALLQVPLPPSQQSHDQQRHQ